MRCASFPRSGSRLPTRVRVSQGGLRELRLAVGFIGVVVLHRLLRHRPLRDTWSLQMSRSSCEKHVCARCLCKNGITPPLGSQKQNQSGERFNLGDIPPLLL